MQRPRIMKMKKTGSSIRMSVDAGLSRQTRSINRSPEAALRCDNIPSPLTEKGRSKNIPSPLTEKGRSNILPSPLAGEGQGEGGTIRPSFLASRRFACGKPGIDTPNDVSGINYSLNKNLSVLFLVWVFGHWLLGINW